MNPKLLYPELLQQYSAPGYWAQRPGEMRALPESTGILGSIADWVQDPSRPERDVAFGGAGNWARKMSQGQQPTWADRVFAGMDMMPPGLDDLAVKGLLAAGSAVGPAWMGRQMLKGGVPSGGAFGKQRGILGGEDGLANQFSPSSTGKFGIEHADIDRRDMLQIAKEAASKGMSKEKIFDATGWYQGIDGKWRSEIDDSAAVFPHAAPQDLAGPPNVNLFNDPRKEVRTKATGPGPRGAAPAIMHPTLGMAYPELADMPVSMTPTKLPQDTRGQFNPKGGENMLGSIDLNTKMGYSADNSTLLHELQHAIQKSEGFGFGSDPIHATKSLKELHEKNADSLDFIKSLPGYERGFKVYADVRDKLIRKAEAGEITDDVLQRKLDELDTMASQRFPEFGMAQNWKYPPQVKDTYQNYKRVSGEVEARNVQRRMGFDRDYRRMLAPWKTEDVPQSEQFVIDTMGRPGIGMRAYAPENARLTQRSNTDRAYQGAAKLFGPDETVIDYGAGLGRGRQFFGNNYVGYERFPEADPTRKGGTLPDITDQRELMKQYKGKADGVVNNLVLNVVPKDVRDTIVKDIGSLLKPGGRAYIATRSATDVDSAKIKQKLDDGWIIGSGDKQTFQKGFKQNELEKYVQDLLGDSYKVSRSRHAPAGNPQIEIKRIK